MLNALRHQWLVNGVLISASGDLICAQRLTASMVSKLVRASRVRYSVLRAQRLTASMVSKLWIIPTDKRRWVVVCSTPYGING